MSNDNNYTVSFPALTAGEYMKAMKKRTQTQETLEQAGAITQIENAVEIVECVTDPVALSKKALFASLRWLRGSK